MAPSLPLVMFGAVSLSSGLLALLFPETAGRSLPETILEAERMGSVKPMAEPAEPAPSAHAANHEEGGSTERGRR